MDPNFSVEFQEYFRSVGTPIRKLYLDFSSFLQEYQTPQ